MKINFVDEFRSIMSRAYKEKLSSRERLLWIALFYMANDRAVYNPQTQTYEWPEEFFSVTNNELTLYTDLDKRAIETLRNRLKQRSLIDFIPGEKKKRQPQYRLFYLTGANIGCNFVPNQSISNNFAPNRAPNHAISNKNAPKDDPKSVPKDVPNRAPKDASISININTDTNIYPDEDDDELTRARDRARAAFSIWYGPRQSMAEADEAARVCWILKLNPELLDEAVHLSAVMGAKTPAAYISTLLRDWHFAGVQNAADLGRYQFNNDVIRGRITGDSSQALSDNQAIREAARGAHAYG